MELRSIINKLLLYIGMTGTRYRTSAQNEFNERSQDIVPQNEKPAFN